MRGDADPEGTRRSQRQRIDLSVAEEGFDRAELEKALRASLSEAQQREKEQPKRKGRSNQKKTNTPKKFEPVEAKKKAFPPKRKRQSSVSEKSDVEDVKSEKKQLLKKAKEEVKKEVKNEKTKGKPEVQKTVKKEVKEEVPKVKETKTISKERPRTRKAAAVVKASPKQTPSAAPGREHALGKRLAHTQASDFITLLACATKVLGGGDQPTDYVL